MKVLAITAHPDDLEIGCAGTLKKFIDVGIEVVSFVTVCPSAEANPKRSKEIVEKEILDSYALSGFNLQVFPTDIDPITGRPNLVCDNKTMTRIAEVLPVADLVILPNPEDSHQDHRTTYDLTWPLIKNTAKEVWIMESWPYCYHYKQNTANLYFDIDWEFKESLLRCYDSYFDQASIDQIKNLHRVNGDKSKNQYAEAFTLKYRYVR